MVRSVHILVGHFSIANVTWHAEVFVWSTAFKRKVLAVAFRLKAVLQTDPISTAFSAVNMCTIQPKPFKRFPSRVQS
jgi:hypothetical protein